jgi:N6-L-threonylcarbamoyladenine synthase
MAEWILGIETSCDETSAAVLRRGGDGAELAGLAILSQDVHRIFGGVVPELASRAHVQALGSVVDRALADAGIGLGQLDGIAVTAGPGLVGALLVGVMYAKTLAYSLERPLLGVNHLEGHLFAPTLEDRDLAPPFVGLLVSGGHTMLLDVPAWGEYRLLGQTLDDAAGEAFDKAAKLLGLAYPGGPAIEQLAKDGDPNAVPLPRPLVGSAEPHFSFAGLKSAVQRTVVSGDFPPQDIAASFQQAVVDCLVDRTRLALQRSDAPALVVAGGVAANLPIRAALAELARAEGRGFNVPQQWLCTDNAAMIAWAGAERFAGGLIDPLDAPARARWPLDPEAEKVRGAGVKA